MTTSNAKLQVVIEALDRTAGTMRGFSERLERVGQSAQQVGRGLGLLSAPILGFAALGTKTFAEFEQQMARVRAVSNATEEEFRLLTFTAQQMGETTQFTAREAADALAFMAMAGMDARTAAVALPSVLQLAASGALELGDAADIVTNVMAGMRLQVDDLGMANDVLVTAFTNTNTSLAQLGEAFKYAGPVAAAAGVSFTETTAALALMGNAGIQATMAGTALRGAISRLVNPTKDISDALNRLGIEVLDSQGRLLPLREIMVQLESVGLEAGDAMQIFGQRAGPGMLALVSQGSAALDELTDRMDESGGTAERIATQQLDTLQGQFKLFQSAVEGTAIQLGQALMPMLRDLLDTLRPLIGRITEFIQKYPDLVKWVTIAAAAVGGLGIALFAVGVLLPGVAGGVRILASAMGLLSAVNLTAISGGIAAIGAAAMAAVAPLLILAAAVTTIPAAVKTGVALLTGDIKGLGKEAQKVAKEGGMAWEVFGKQVVDEVTNIIEVLGVRGLVDTLGNVLSPSMEEAKENFDALIDSAQEAMNVHLELEEAVIDNTEALEDETTALAERIEKGIEWDRQVLRMRLGLTDLSDDLDALTNSWRGQIPVLEEVSGEVRQYGDFMDESTERLAAYFEANIEWRRELREQGLPLLVDVTEALERLTRQWDGQAVSIRDATRALEEHMETVEGMIPMPPEGLMPGFLKESRIEDLLGQFAPGPALALESAARAALEEGIDAFRTFLSSLSLGQRGFLNLIGQVSPTFPAIEGFGGGGIVSGPIGAPRLIVAHGGERVSRDGAAPSVNFYGPVYGLEDLRDRVVRWVKDEAAGGGYEGVLT